MEFYSPNGIARPVRLCEQTRRFAAESLGHKYGLDTARVPAIELDGVEGIDSMTAIERYDAAISAIAAEAPVRICEGERISGAATLGLAIKHSVPATFRGKPVFSSVSHLTVDFETVLRRGINGIRKDANDALIKYKGTEKEEFILSCLSCIESFEIWHKPSFPGRISTKAPKSIILFTVPL